MNTPYDILLTESEVKEALIAWIKQNRKIPTSNSKDTKLKIVTFSQERKLFGLKWRIK